MAVAGCSDLGSTNGGSAGAAARDPGAVLPTAGGADTCGEGPVTVIDELVGNGTAPVIDVIALDVFEADGARLTGVAQRTGGSYTAVSDPAALFAAVDELAVQPAEALRPTLCSPPAGNQATACQTRFRNDVAAEFATQAEQLRQAGDQTVAGMIDNLATAVDGTLANQGRQSVDAEVEEAQRQLDEARSRFEQRYGEPLPGEDLTGCVTSSPSAA